MPRTRWQLFGFMDALREWMRHDPPPGELLVTVAAFGAELERAPQDGAELEHANLFYREMPGTEHDGWIVTVTFTVHLPSDSRFAGDVRCQDVACVPHPARSAPPAWPPPKHH